MSLMNQEFVTPSLVMSSLVLYALAWWLKVPDEAANVVLLAGVAVGSWRLVVDTVRSLLQKTFALDYIAILAITVGLLTHNYLVAGVIVLMMSGGNALEDFAQRRAKKSLTALKNRIPNQAQVVEASGEILTQAIDDISIGSVVLVRKGEVVPIDGVLVSDEAILDESSLTGEAYPVSKEPGDAVRSGTLNVGQVLQLKTTVVSRDSSYSKIVALVQEAETVQTPFVQLADSLSLWFTVVTLVLAGLALLLSGDWQRVLAVLVIATPCPLILATPIALIGGLNSAARQRTIFKRLAALEAFARVDTMVFDKTGTLTLGQPQLESVTVLSESLTKKQVLALASGLEKNSLHPYAKAIVADAAAHRIKPAAVTEVSEQVGRGISGRYRGQRYHLAASRQHPDSQVVLYRGSSELAVFSFRDELKRGTTQSLERLMSMGVEIHIFTGDTAERASQLRQVLPDSISVQTDLKPEDKQRLLRQLKQRGQVVGMVGDGINDAPALALADVGLAFAHQEQTAASEAADIVVLGGDVTRVVSLLQIARRTMTIARQSIFVGLGLSIGGMLLAVAGLLPPILGAIAQELIDVAVIVNALRSTQLQTVSRRQRSQSYE